MGDLACMDAGNMEPILERSPLALGGLPLADGGLPPAEGGLPPALGGRASMSIAPGGAVTPSG